MEINKVLLEDGTYEIIITKGNQVFKMTFGGNGDLYWQLENKKDLFSDEEFFTIDKENYLLFSSFQELYRRIAECDIYDIDPLELEFCETREEEEELYRRKEELNNNVRNSEAYNQLYSESGISFISDEDIPYSEENTLTIVKSYDGESFIIQFSKSSDKRDFLDIRFRTSGSRYHEFIHVFLDQYNALCSEDFDYHQIHLEEIMYQKRLKKQPSFSRIDE